MWNNSHPLLVGVYNGTTALEEILAVYYRTKRALIL